MNDLKIEANIIAILPVKTGTSTSGKDWSNQIFVLESSGEYPKKTAFQASGKLLDDVKKMSVGQKVTVYFNVVSREYNEQWYTQANAWKIEGLGASVATHEVVNEISQDLPF